MSANPPTVAELLALAEGPGITHAPLAEPLTVEEMVALELNWRGDDTRLGRQLRGLIAAVMVRDERARKAREGARLWKALAKIRHDKMYALADHDEDRLMAAVVAEDDTLKALVAIGIDPDAPEGT